MNKHAATTAAVSVTSSACPSSTQRTETRLTSALNAVSTQPIAGIYRHCGLWASACIMRRRMRSVSVYWQQCSDNCVLCTYLSLYYSTTCLHERTVLARLHFYTI